MKHTRSIGLFTLAVLAALTTLPARAADAAPAEKKPTWEKAVTASLTMTRGNSETFLGSIGAAAERKWEKNEFKLGVGAAYGKTTERILDTATGDTIKEDTVSVNNVSGFLQYNRLFSERLFGFVRADGLHDEISGIDYRFIFSPGLGFYFIKKPDISLCGEVGPSYVVERLDGNEDDYAALRVADTFSKKFGDRVKVWQKTEILPSLEYFSHVLINSEVGASAALTPDNKLALTVTLNHMYNSHPAYDPNKPRRMKNDLILKSGITYAF